MSRIELETNVPYSAKKYPPGTFPQGHLEEANAQLNRIKYHGSHDPGNIHHPLRHPDSGKLDADERHRLAAGISHEDWHKIKRYRSGHELSTNNRLIALAKRRAKLISR